MGVREGALRRSQAAAAGYGARVPAFRPTTQFELVSAIEGSATFWELTCALLHYWRSTEPDDSAAHHMIGTPYLAWGDIVQRTKQHFAGPRAPDDLDAADRAFLVKATSRGLIADAVHAVAWGLSHAVAHTFAPAWCDALGGGRHTLSDGDFYPVADAPWAQLGVELSSRPASMSTPPVGELPTVRVHDASRFELIVDFTLSRALEAVAAGLDRVAAVHPNETLAELRFPEVDRQVFPVAPADPARQRAVLLDLVGRALSSGATLSVLPELSATAADVDALHALVLEHEAPHLLIAGSHHRTTADGDHENLAVGLVAGHDDRLEHRKATPFSQELGYAPPTKEGIRQRERLQVVVHQADRFRVSLAVCKELLDQRRASALDRAAANLVLVPALSFKTAGFVDAAAGRVPGAQAVTVVVNGPLRAKDGVLVTPAVIIGQPVAGRSVVASDVPGPAPSLTVLDVPA
jgi:predicted amidohydrolase